MRLLVPSLLCACACAKAYGWGEVGHRAIARIAEASLTPAAHRAIDQLLAAESRYGVPGCPVATLGDAAVWADCLRKRHDEWATTFAWHYDDNPICDAAPRERYCPDGQCLSVQTRRLVQVLSDQTAGTRERLQALKFVTHLVGDAHQPLHAANNQDRGGNDQPLRLPSSHAGRTNLHRLWDTDLVERLLGNPLSESAFAALAGGITDQQGRDWGRGDIEQWIAESHQLAITRVYAPLPAPPVCHGPPSGLQTIGESYVMATADTVRDQLRRAGIRLALVLNSALR